MYNRRRGYGSRTPKCEFEGGGSTFRIYSTYNRQFVDDLKASVPPSSRQWVPMDKVWQVSTQYLDVVAQLAESAYGFVPEQAGIFDANSEEKITFRLEYIGGVYKRGPDLWTASGWVNGGWNATFTKESLQNFFGFSDNGGGKTYYAVLGVRNTASGVEIRKAHRRAARTWHPDVNKEPEAPEMFRKIQEAYELLSDPLKRKRYDAALSFVSEIPQTMNQERESLEWRAPVSCGDITATVIRAMGKIEVLEIHAWEDVVENGLTMVSNWPRGRHVTLGPVVEWRE